MPSDDGTYCVDFIVDDTGSFGYALFRSDPEDHGAWTLLSRSTLTFASAHEAALDAGTSISWLTAMPSASRDYRAWVERTLVERSPLD